ncbi:unnamed protein product [Amoebophrya sp. A25]|nr:unnamed protein product [Amoebophrya sp. A25]|eukprot:GSA25T00009370001.1
MLSMASLPHIMKLPRVSLMTSPSYRIPATMFLDVHRQQIGTKRNIFENIEARLEASLVNGLSQGSEIFTHMKDNLLTRVQEALKHLKDFFLHGVIAGIMGLLVNVISRLIIAMVVTVAPPGVAEALMLVLPTALWGMLSKAHVVALFSEAFDKAKILEKSAKALFDAIFAEGVGGLGSDLQATIRDIYAKEIKPKLATFKDNVQSFFTGKSKSGLISL